MHKSSRDGALRCNSDSNDHLIVVCRALIRRERDQKARSAHTRSRSSNALFVENVELTEMAMSGSILITH